MSDHLVVCIARQFGSGGREIGYGLSRKLGIDFYDKEILKHAADKSGILQEHFEKADEKPASGLLHTGFGMETSKALTYADYVGYLPNDRMQDVITDVIREVAAKGPCVIIGRCADYILRGQPKTLSVFVHAGMEQRIQRIQRMHNLEEDAARSLIRKTDRSRANYYSYYTDREWNDADNYHLCIDAGRFGVENSISVIAHTCEVI